MGIVSILGAALHLRTAYGIPLLRSIRIAWLIVHRPFAALKALDQHAPILAAQIRAGLLIRSAMMGLGQTTMPEVRADDTWSLRGPQ